MHEKTPNQISLDWAEALPFNDTDVSISPRVPLTFTDSALRLSVEEYLLNAEDSLPLYIPRNHAGSRQRNLTDKGWQEASKHLSAVLILQPLIIDFCAGFLSQMQTAFKPSKTRYRSKTQGG